MLWPRSLLSPWGIPTFKGYRISASICASINNEVVHGIPGLRGKSWDIISIDIGVTYEGYVGDSAFDSGWGSER